jgi:hypothetical protein
MTVLSPYKLEAIPNWNLKTLQSHFALQGSVLKMEHNYVTKKYDWIISSASFVLSKSMNLLKYVLSWVDYLF